MELIITENQAGMRLDAALAENLPGFSRNKIQKIIRTGGCQSNGEILDDPAIHVRAGQHIFFTPPAAASQLIPSSGDLEIIWQDEDLAIINKPAGLTVHPCPSCQEETLVHRLLARFPQLKTQTGERPGIAHRLDKDTSGLMAIGLNEASRLALSEMFAKREIHKKYLALVYGCPPKSGEAHFPIGRHPVLKTKMAIVDEKKGGRTADTEWLNLWHAPDRSFSLLQVIIHTGRTHQIRLHLSHLGWPVIGDATYGAKASANMAQRQMLHAWQLELPHPVTGEKLKFTLPPPADFFDAIGNNIKINKKIIVTGNQGCGKSSFCSKLEKHGFPVISADQIVSSLYSQKGEASWWIKTHFDGSGLNADGTVNKQELFKLFQKNPLLRHEFENVIHGLVWQKIEDFWELHSTAQGMIAEIPLFFESNLQTKIKDAIIVGIHCPENIRWQRIAENRGWSEEKIRSIEAWQWPESRKMASCQVVIDNEADETALDKAANEFTSNFLQKINLEKAEIDAKIKDICGTKS